MKVNHLIIGLLFSCGVIHAAVPSSDFFDELVQDNQTLVLEDETLYLISLDVFSPSSSHSVEHLRKETLVWRPNLFNYRLNARNIEDIQEHALYSQHYDDETNEPVFHEGEYEADGDDFISYDTFCPSTFNIIEEEKIDETTSYPYALAKTLHLADPPLEDLIKEERDLIVLTYAPFYPTSSLQDPNLHDHEQHAAYFDLSPQPSLTTEPKLPTFPSAPKPPAPIESSSLSKLQQIENFLSYSNYAKDTNDPLLSQLFGQNFLKMSGYYQYEAFAGCFEDQGEFSDKVRVTLINGILNIEEDLHLNLKQLKSTHGGVNIHFIFRPTKGWTSDFVDCCFAKSGYISGQPHLLAAKWKELIQEMGGVDGGGEIIHYAHSIGGTETSLARQLLTPQEQKMIHVITIGSPTLIPNEGFASVINYVSKRDAVCLTDPIGYLTGWLSPSSNVVFVGSFLGIPFGEHMLDCQSYDDVLKTLGEQFVKKYKPK